MRILMITPQPFFEPRGTPISVYQRLESLSALQYQVDVLTYHVGEDVSIPGITLYRGPNVPFIKKVKIGPSWKKFCLDLLLFFQAIVLLRKNHYDVIHSHEEAAFFAVLLSKMFHTYHIYDMHSSLPRQLAGNPRWNLWPFVKSFEKLERWVINTCDAIITIGVDLEEHVLTINPEAKTVLIQNLAVLADDGRSDDTSTRELKERLRLDNRLAVVYTGTFERYQGLDLLLKSAKIVKEHCPEVSFILVGGDPQQVKDWQHRSNVCGLEDSMLFVGTVPLADALAYLDVAEILVSPRTEGTSVPLKIYSYLHSGKAIVATDLDAHSQVLNGEMAILVTPTEEAFAQGIVKLAQSPDLRRELGHRARQFARERFNPADYLTRLKGVYQQVTLTTSTEEQTSDVPAADQNRPSSERWLRLP